MDKTPNNSSIPRWVWQVPAQAELIPVQPPQDVPDPEDWGQPRTSGQSSEQHPGGSSLCPPSSEPREEPLGADGCDMGESDPLWEGRKICPVLWETGPGSQTEQFHDPKLINPILLCLQMTWTGSWGSCPRISSQPQHRLTVAEPQLLLRVTVTHLPPTCLSLFVSLVFVVGLRAGETLWALRPLSHSQICIN